MIAEKTNTPGRLLIMAWPEAIAMTDGGWYDPVLKAMGVNKNGVHKTGHAAIALFNLENGTIHYADFGRYIIPHGYGRTRSIETDPDVVVEMKAEIKDNEVVNLKEILKFMVDHEPFHGSGPLWVTLVDEIVSCEETLDYIRSYQERGDVRYGPFKIGGSNCSRFVCDVAKEMLAEKKKVFQLKTPVILTPTPLGNIYSTSLGRTPIYKVTLDKKVEEVPYKWEKPSTLMLKDLFVGGPYKLGTNRVGTLVAPQRTKEVAEDAIWLGGLGAGAWFSLVHKYENVYEMERRNENGELDFKKEYLAEQDDFDFNKPYEIQYNSNARWCHVMQDGNLFKFIATTEVSSKRVEIYSEAVF